jgi:hypothetical protein
MVDIAEQTALRLLQLSEADRLEYVKSLHRVNPVLWSLVKSKLHPAREEVNKPVGRSDWIRRLLGDIMPDKYPPPEDNLGLGI